jgi:hypothetical protein
MSSIVQHQTGETARVMAGQTLDHFDRRELMIIAIDTEGALDVSGDVRVAEKKS